MKVQMTEHREGGWHDGTAWRSYPPVGGVVDVPDGMGADLCRQGAAKPVAEERAAETRPAPDTGEKRAGRQKPAQGRAGTSAGPTAG